MLKRLKSFVIAEDAAVTVDWIVLSAATVGLAIAAYAVINPGAADLITTASTAVETQNTDFSTSIEDYLSE